MMRKRKEYVCEKDNNSSMLDNLVNIGEVGNHVAVRARQVHSHELYEIGNGRKRKIVGSH